MGVLLLSKTRESVQPAAINPLPPASRTELRRFWAAHPDLQDECKAKYGHDPVTDAAGYWAYGIAEPEHADVLAAVHANGGTFTLALVKEWERQELVEAGKEAVHKTQARGAELKLRVVGVSKTPDGSHVYRMATRDGRYVGRTLPTRHRAVKGDVLKIQANDFGISELGDPLWLNPNVVSGYSDRADSWKMLEAIAGGPIVKDNAPGPAGDLPPANDKGASSAMPSGPTLDAVHVSMPLPDISQGYMNRRLKAKIVKADKMQQLVYGVVLEPNVLDSQDDFMLPRHVEAAAHNYLKKAIRGKSAVAKLQHRKQAFFRDKPSLVPVESFIAPVDFTYDGVEMIAKGTWVVAMHVEDAGLWQDFLDGKYTGFSIGGSGIRQAFNAPDDEVPHGLIAPPGTDGWNQAWAEPSAARSLLAEDLLAGRR